MIARRLLRPGEVPRRFSSALAGRAGLGPPVQRMARRVEVIVVAVLLVVSLAHLLRLVTGAELMIAGKVTPVWISLFGCIGPAVLAGLFWWTRH